MQRLSLALGNWGQSRLRSGTRFTWYSPQFPASRRHAQECPRSIADNLVSFALMLLLFGASVAHANEGKDEKVINWPSNPPAHWARYHLAHPDPNAGFFPGDPNPAFHYKGRYHLHYLYPDTGGLGMAHVSSTDMVHWEWHAPVLNPSTLGHAVLSGTGFFTKDGRPAIIYSDNENLLLVYGLDDTLDTWTKPEKVVVHDADGNIRKIAVWDPDCWLNGDTYYAIGGSKEKDLIRSKDLKTWEYVGGLMHADFPNDLGVTPNDDLSCPNMFQLGDQWMLLCISHALGCRYFLGGFKDEQYLPQAHALMNWQNVYIGQRGLGYYFAPESMLTADGRRVMWAWLFPEEQPPVQQGLQSLPRELALGADGRLRINPLRELQSLRRDERRAAGIMVQNLVPCKLPDMAGDDLEFEIVFGRLDETYKANMAGDVHIPRAFGMQVLCDENGQNGVPIAINPSQQTLSIAGVTAPFPSLIDEEVTLRVFIDNTVIEVFANDRQAIAYTHRRTHPHANNQLFSDQGNMPVNQVTAWRMQSPWAREEAEQ